MMEKNKEADEKTASEQASSQEQCSGRPYFSEEALNGFLGTFKSELTHVAQEIGSLNSEQTKLLDRVTEHNNVIENSPDMSQLVEVMDEMKGKMDQLTKLRQDMVVVHERSEKLKNRAERLENYYKQMQKKEEDLVAKMDKPAGPSEQS